MFDKLNKPVLRPRQTKGALHKLLKRAWVSSPPFGRGQGRVRSLTRTSPLPNPLPKGEGEKLSDICRKLTRFQASAQSAANVHRQDRATTLALKRESRELYRVAKDDLRLLRQYPHSYVPTRAISFAVALHNSAS